MTVELNTLQRQCISQILMGKSGLTIKDMKMCLDIDKSITPSKEELKALHTEQCGLCRQPVGFDPENAITGEKKPFEFEKSELRFIKDALEDNVKNINPGIYKTWFGETFEAFSEAVKQADSPAAA